MYILSLLNQENKLFSNYRYLKPLLFKLEPETAHSFSLKLLRILSSLSLIRPQHFHNPVTVMGIEFPNRLGLAGGFDRHCEYLSALGKLGFGFIEAGTIVPKPQQGNPKPRIFRIREHEALINRVGFYSKGADYAEMQLKKTRYEGVLGISVGKNLATPVESAITDYLFGLRRFYQYADFITINISSPNTPGLRELQYDRYLNTMLQSLKDEQQLLQKHYNKYVPIVVKIDPDLSDDKIENMAKSLLKYQFDGIIATNTTVGRKGVEGAVHADEEGGLSGKPLFPRTLHTVEILYKHLQENIPIIACGGIMSGDDAKIMLTAGAKLVQMYTGFIYKGPALIEEIVTAVS